jgi:hypothetical protein
MFRMRKCKLSNCQFEHEGYCTDKEYSKTCEAKKDSDLTAMDDV